MKAITLIDLDALLDTRLGTLFSIDEDEANNILFNGWHQRLSDDLTEFDTIITNEEFKDAYDNREVETLKASRVTNIIKSLAMENKKLFVDLLSPNTPLEDYCIVINIYPYAIDLDTQYELGKAIAELMGGDPPIKFVDLLPDSTRLSYLEMHGFTDYITYDISGWMVREFNDCKNPEDFTHCPNITVWGPRLLTSKNSLNQVLKEHTEIDPRDSPFEICRVIFGACVKLEFLPVEDFCIYSP